MDKHNWSDFKSWTYQSPPNSTRLCFQVCRNGPPSEPRYSYGSYFDLLCIYLHNFFGSIQWKTSNEISYRYSFGDGQCMSLGNTLGRLQIKFYCWVAWKFEWCKDCRVFEYNYLYSDITFYSHVPILERELWIWFSWL